MYSDRLGRSTERTVSCGYKLVTISSEEDMSLLLENFYTQYIIA